MRRTRTPSIRTSAALSLGALLTAATLGPGALAAQEETERYIPIGRSPGVSGVTSVIGEVEAVDDTADPEEHIVTVRAEGVEVRVRLVEDTRIWIDRSALGLTNLVGTHADCEVGRRIEVEFFDPDRREVADWVKVAPRTGQEVSDREIATRTTGRM